MGRYYYLWTLDAWMGEELASLPLPPNTGCHTMVHPSWIPLCLGEEEGKDQNGVQGILPSVWGWGGVDIPLSL